MGYIIIAGIVATAIFFELFIVGRERVEEDPLQKTLNHLLSILGSL